MQGAAVIPPLNPDILITESTYATTVRESRKTRERELLQAVSATVANGGKVLIPVFALGSAQELSILLDEHWRRQGLTVCCSTLELLHDIGITSDEHWRRQGRTVCCSTLESLHDRVIDTVRYALSPLPARLAIKMPSMHPEMKIKLTSLLLAFLHVRAR